MCGKYALLKVRSVFDVICQSVLDTVYALDTEIFPDRCVLYG